MTTKRICMPGLLLSVLVIGCRPSARADPSASASVAAPASAAASAAASVVPDIALRQARSEVKPTALLTLPLSAYASSLAVDEEAVYLLTAKAAYRLLPGQEPEAVALDLGVGPALTDSSYLYWSKGAIWRAPKRGGGPHRIATVMHQPQEFVTSGERFAWLDRTDEGHFAILTLEGARPRVMFSSAGDIDAIAMLDDRVFFVERAADSSWRFSSIRRAGGEPSFSASRRGRTPAMLRVTSDIHYYDGNTIEIRRLSPDFTREETLTTQLICSPMAVSARIYCAHVRGVFEVSEQPRTPVLIQSVQGITAIAASPKLVAWTRDLGPDRLAVEMVPLPSSLDRSGTR